MTGPASPAPEAPSAFAEALGPRLADLPPAVRALHAGPGVYEGRISFGATDPSRARLAGLLPSLRDAPFSLRILRQEGVDRWERRIAGSGGSFSEQRCAGPMRVAEKIGPLVGETELRFENNALRMSGRRLTALGLPVPRLLWRIATEEREQDGLYHFDIRIGVTALAPRLIRYHGWLDTLGRGG